MEDQNLLIGTRSKRAVHRPQASCQSHTHDHPRIRRHEPVGPPAAMQGARRHANDPNTQARMHESFVQKRPFVRRHAPIFARLAVEHEVRGDHRAADDGGAVEEPLRHAAGIGARDLAAGLHVGTAERLLEGISRLDERRQGRGGLEGRGFGRAVECTACGLRAFGELFEACGDGHRPTE